jgi:NADPH:quinone reductase-like Zn-dependent oxidoreductase
MDTMKAIRIHGYGGPEVLRYEDAPRPIPGSGEVLIRVHAAGVNPVDWKIREGLAKDGLRHSLPLIPGWDAAGVVESPGPGVAGFKQGDRVYAYSDLARDGAYAQFLVARQSEVALKPKSLSYLQAAALPVSGLTAWQSLFDAAGLEAGDRVLIHGAAGGVGSLAVQLAKWKGARVIATASRHNHSFLRELGAEETIDYQATRFEDVVHDVDVVLDTIGGDTQKRSWQVLRKGGILVSLVSRPSPEEAAAFGARQAVIDARPDAVQLAEIARLADSRKLKPVIETVLPLPEARRAQEISQGGHVRGKVILNVVG